VLAHARCPVLTLRDEEEVLDQAPPEHDRISL
jgi:hypothetical protein